MDNSKLNDRKIKTKNEGKNALNLLPSAAQDRFY